MSNFVLWFGISLIIICLNKQGGFIGDANLITAWRVVGFVCAVIDTIRFILYIGRGDRR